MTSDLTYRNDEWEINGAIIASDVEITLTVKREYGSTFLDLYVGELFQPGEKSGTMISGWLYAAMRVWVAKNQSKLTQILWDRQREPRAA